MIIHLKCHRFSILLLKIKFLSISEAVFFLSILIMGEILVKIRSYVRGKSGKNILINEWMENDKKLCTNEKAFYSIEKLQEKLSDQYSYEKKKQRAKYNKITRKIVRFYYFLSACSIVIREKIQ